MNQSKQQEQINRMIDWIQCRNENIIFKWMKINKFELLESFFLNFEWDVLVRLAEHNQGT